MAQKERDTRIKLDFTGLSMSVLPQKRVPDARKEKFPRKWQSSSAHAGLVIVMREYLVSSASGGLLTTLCHDGGP